MERVTIKLFFSDKIIFLSALAGLVGNIAVWATAISFYRKAKEAQVFLHYSVHLGVDLTGDKGRIFYLPSLGFLILLVNLVLAYLIFLKEKNLSRIAVISVFWLEMFILGDILFLSFLNF